MIGTVLDKFEVLQKIGEGGMATVYRGRHTPRARRGDKSTAPAPNVPAAIASVLPARPAPSNT